MAFVPWECMSPKGNGSSLADRLNIKRATSRDTSNSTGQQSQKITTLYLFSLIFLQTQTITKNSILPSTTLTLTKGPSLLLTNWSMKIDLKTFLSQNKLYVIPFQTTKSLILSLLVKALKNKFNMKEKLC